MGIFLAVFAALDAGAALAARPDNTVALSRRTRIRAEVRIQADTLTAQTLVAIRKDTQDGAWLVASAGPLLDNFRDGSEASLPDTVRRVLVSRIADAGLAPTDTLIRNLGRRILRAPLLEQDAAAGFTRRRADGRWEFVEDAAAGDLDGEFARARVQADDADREAIESEIRRQAAERASAPAAGTRGCLSCGR